MRHAGPESGSSIPRAGYPHIWCVFREDDPRVVRVGYNVQIDGTASLPTPDITPQFVDFGFELTVPAERDGRGRDQRRAHGRGGQPPQIAE